MQRTARCLHTIARFPVGGCGKGFDDFFHRFPWQYSSDVMRDGRHNLAPAPSGEFGKN